VFNLSKISSRYFAFARKGGHEGTRGAPNSKNVSERGNVHGMRAKISHRRGSGATLQGDTRTRSHSGCPNEKPNYNNDQGGNEPMYCPNLTVSPIGVKNRESTSGRNTVPAQRPELKGGPFSRARTQGVMGCAKGGQSTINGEWKRTKKTQTTTKRERS